MGISWFFNSYPGMFIAQSFTHSFIAAIVVNRAIKAWRIRSPLVKQRFHYLVIMFPLVAFPVYSLINPARKALAFRLGALFDVNRWLAIEMLGSIPGHLFFILLLAVTSLIFFFQEAFPIIRHMFSSHDKTPGTFISDDSVVADALASLAGEVPDFFVLDDDEILLYSTTGKNASLYLSRGLIQTLSFDELQAALAHEIAHITRNRKPHLLIVFLFRIVLFFNPVALVEFRRVVQEEEKICDDIAVETTGKPSVLAETLRKLYLPEKAPQKAITKDFRRVGSTVEERSHSLLIQSRITRLEREREGESGLSWLKLFSVAAVVAGINYFVV